MWSKAGTNKNVNKKLKLKILTQSTKQEPNKNLWKSKRKSKLNSKNATHIEPSCRIPDVPGMYLIWVLWKLG